MTSAQTVKTTDDQDSAPSDVDLAELNHGDAEDAIADTNAEGDGTAAVPRARRRPHWARTMAFALLPALIIGLAAAAGYLKWMDSSARDSQSAAADASRAASDSTVAILSYKSDTAEADLTGARDRLTGTFKDAYGSLISQVVIPGAKEKHIAAQAKVVATAPESATPSRAAVLVFIDQTVTVGNDPPTDTTSTVRVTLAKVNGRWLISQFDPI